MKYIKKDKQERYSVLKTCCFLAIIFVVCLTIGFSAFFTTLYINDLSMKFRLQEDIRVTNISVSSTSNNATSSWEEYNVKNVYGSVSLPNSDSTVTYEVEVINYGNIKEGIFDIDELYKIGSLTDSLEDTSIVLGGNIANHNKDIESMTILEFSVTRNQS